MCAPPGESAGRVGSVGGAQPEQRGGRCPGGPLLCPRERKAASSLCS